MDSDVIQNVIVFPYSKQFCQYKINNGQFHTKKYDDLYDYLGNLFPSLAYEMHKLLMKNAPFLILPDKMMVKELKFDLEGELEKLKDSIKRFNTSQCFKEYQSQQSSDSLDDLVDDLFQKYGKWD